MIKKLDLLILRAFIAPFLATFLIATFVLVMQFFWLYIDDLIGKGLDFVTICQLITCVAATTVPLALPIAILLSSIMTFGNLGESFELVAIKSAGIPLLRFMRPILLVSVVISGVAFLFANNVIPVANLKLNALKYNFTFSKPAFDIKEGIFYDKIEGYVLKIGRKDKDGPGIYNVLVYEKEQGGEAAPNVIVSKSGLMQMSADKQSLEFIMKNGTRYEERGTRGNKNADFIRLGFEEYKKVFDLSSFKSLKIDDSSFQDINKMKNIKQINRFLDSTGRRQDTDFVVIKKQSFLGMEFPKYYDSGWIKQLPPYQALIGRLDQKGTDSAVALVAKLYKTAILKMNKPVPDSVRRQFTNVFNNLVKQADAIVPDSIRNTVADLVNSRIAGAKNVFDGTYPIYSDRSKNIRSHKIEWHRKFALSAACLVLFLIGAPLGSIIRKGGIGTPLIFAIIFFVLFHLMNTFGEKFAKQAITSPLLGMWLATFVLIPIGFFLTYKAMKDSQLFNQEYYFRIYRNVKTWIGIKMEDKKIPFLKKRKKLPLSETDNDPIKLA